MIAVQNIHKKFGKLAVLQGLTFSINKGGIYAVLGPNGSGKTTLLKIILGMVIPDKGDIVIEGKRENGQFDYRKRIGYLPQIAQFPENLTVRELIAMIKDVRNVASDESGLIDQLQLKPHLEKKLGGLSGGTKQKVNIVLTFMFDSDIYILDEPTAGLDPVSLIFLKELIAEKQRQAKTILLTTHIMSLVEQLSDEIVFLLDGKIHFQGTIDQLEASQQTKGVEKSIATLLQHVEDIKV